MPVLPDHTPQLSVNWQLPAPVADMLRAAALSSAATFQSFHLVLSLHAGSGELAEYVGVVRQVNGYGQLALAHVVAQIGLRKVYDYVERRSCGSCYLIGRCCSTHREPVPRGYSPAELLKIETALRATSRQKMVEVLGDRGVAGARSPAAFLATGW